MEETVKGTVTSLSSLFSPEEAQKASKRVQDSIADRQKELSQLRQFVADNNNLVNLVQKIPDELHHEIMVPFGNAAFFPGRLIHTNEFLVLLGEGYHVERTSKQTIEILKRRGKVLDSQVESLKAVMQDLKAEASFFDATAAEAAEGLVEIREDYVEETSTEMGSKTEISGSMDANHPRLSKRTAEDEEYDRLFSRMDELEKEEELAAESKFDENDEYAPMISTIDEVEKDKFVAKIADEYDEDGQTESCFGPSTSQQSLSNKHKHVQFEGVKLQPISEGGCSDEQTLVPNKPNLVEKNFLIPEVKENVQPTSTSANEAFTGTIVERSPKPTTSSSKSSTSQPSKTVSRFKMQRR